jgi:DNA-binding CsgD family transcriptional regulator/tetratricopeptide (TPR) repeat protein
LVQALTGADAEVVDECLQAGLLHWAGRRLRFRHELARLAVEASLPELRRVGLHTQVLAWLRERTEVDPARLAYHADEAGDAEAVVEYAPVAAERAARLGAHREAARHYAQALQNAHLLAPRDHADLLERYAKELQLVGERERCLEALDQALVLRNRLGDVGRVAVLEARRAAALGNLSRSQEARQAVDAAVEMLAALPPDPIHAEVLWRASHVRMANREAEAAVGFAERALRVAERFEDQEQVAFALYALGVAQWFVEPDVAESAMVRALELGRDLDDERLIASCLLNLGSAAGEMRYYACAQRWLREGIEWQRARDLDLGHSYCSAWLARIFFEQGRWVEAATCVDNLVESPLLMARVTAANVAGRLRIRRGDAGHEEPLLAARSALAEQPMLQWQWPVSASLAEAAWLDGRCRDIPRYVHDLYRLAIERDQPWARGELGFWLWRAGELRKAPEGAAEPFALQIDGDWRGAAAAWEEIGCPYEVAVALADGDDPDELRRAFTILAGLGAAPMADRVAARLREVGVHDLPRRPSRATVDNPGGLTGRQLEVLGQLGEGRTNAQIAAALHISPKTVGHHVSAILDKLGVGDRREAARLARDRGFMSN